MRYPKKPLLVLLCTAVLFGTSGCADDSLSKGLIAGLGAGLMGFAGYKLCKRDHRMACTIGGAVVGGIFGSLVAGKIGTSQNNSSVTGTRAQ